VLTGLCIRLHSLLTCDGGRYELKRGSIMKVEKLIIAFVDVSGYAKYSKERPPDDIFNTMSRYCAFADELITASKGKIVKFIGDELLVIFPESIYKDIKTVLGNIKSALENWFFDKIPNIEINIKAHIGDVACGVIKTVNNEWFDVYGEAVNTAALLNGCGIVFSPDLEQIFS
jgi:class 3 adenylate cyclase